MDLTVLNTNLDAISIVDTYESFIWTDRYYKYGDFELYAAMREGILDFIRQDYYLQSRDSDHVMIIEKLLISSDVEDGNHITITGRSLESILDRRIIWGQKTLSGNLQNGIKTLLNESIISPSDKNRKIDNFVFEASDDPAITKLTIEAQYTGDNLYDVIQKICEERSIGFKVTLNDKKQFVFKLYAGTNRSYDQTEVPYVVFSPNFENIINSNYVESKSSLKNITLVGGEGAGAARKYTTVGSGSGLNRREFFTDARDISSDIGNGNVLTDAEYTAQLKQRGNEKLAENTDITSFEGQVETTVMFRYGEDFFNGDVVQIANEYGHETTARILEIVISENEEGTSVYPTFKTITEEGE
ncbi:MAG: siphovirus ReqiPepy6 Gp37-like family protein [Erysipelotrichaceae bacterium]|nr:siphovirus ReqiPepy6 Gp37-like family protein [Erysipelotrichaceae bacterium]